MKNNSFYISVFGLIVALVFTGGCSENTKDPVLSDFNKVVKLESTVSYFKSSELGEIVDLLVVDSILIINEMFNDHIFKLFDINTGKLINNCIKKGKGPNEMVFPRVISSYKNDVFTTYSENDKKLIYISIQDLLKNQFKFSEVHIVENEMLDALKAFPINDSLVICTGMFEKGRLCLYNLITKRGTVKFDYPYDEKHDHESNVGKGLAFQSSISIKPDLKRFVLTCSHSGNIEIFKLGNDDFSRLYRSIYYLPLYENLNNHGARFSKLNKLAYISQVSTDKYIYTLYSGHTREDQGSEYYNANNLLVYDWDGHAIINFKLDRNIRDMTLRKDKMEIYAYSINHVTGKPEIIVYKLPYH